MKKIISFAAVLVALIFGLPYANAADAQNQGMREVISTEQPQELKGLLQSVQIAGALEVQKFSSQGNDVYDYALQYMISVEGYESWLEVADKEMNADVVSIFALTPVKDASGAIEDYTAEFVGAVFYTEHFSWFKDQATKAMFDKALEAHRATQ